MNGVIVSFLAGIRKVNLTPRQLAESALLTPERVVLLLASKEASLWKTVSGNELEIDRRSDGASRRKTAQLSRRPIFFLKHL
jgi:hypothetical protein